MRRLFDSIHYLYVYIDNKDNSVDIKFCRGGI